MQSEDHGLQQMDAALRVSLGLFSQYRGLAKIALVQAVGLGAVFEERRHTVNDRLTRLVQTRLEVAAAEEYQSAESGSRRPRLGRCVE